MTGGSGRLPVGPGSLLRLLPATFLIYLVGGLTYSLVLPTLGAFGTRLGVLPYMALLPAAAWTTAYRGREWAGRAGPTVLGLGFLGWALLSGPARDLAAQGLAVGGYAFADVFFWNAFAARADAPTRALGLGLGTMVGALSAGMVLAPKLAEWAQGREEVAALVATGVLLTAATCFPLWRGGAAAQTPTADLAAAGARWGLSPRELEVLIQLAKGLTNKEAARELGISPHTVRKLLERAYRKMGVRSRTEALVRLLGGEPSASSSAPRQRDQRGRPVRFTPGEGARGRRP